MSNDDNTLLKVEINNYLNENNLSLRKFSKIVDIPTSTLSRIINSKQKPSITHIKKLSKFIPLFLNSFLNDDLSSKDINIDITNTQAIQNNELYNILKFSQFADSKKLNQEINNQFNKCKEYAKTQDGINMIKSDFDRKIKEINGVGPLIDSLENLYSRYILENPSSTKALIIGAVLLYFIIPLDVIPDYLFGIGYIDDMLLLQFELSVLDKLKSN
ncbi:helix-turn-helix domain-containing protein [Clostridium sp. NSJ-6]|uniref:Helix-turn-helix domain-containing protein n=1 Tax=Clostridium hominis TaxID=2763036 RepID=A0ABR7DBR9_9CLOT|nr:DUF1232 domain-containing protein [Clostridium hominis]MBC5628846.1 helix-turn-helix domain-containing protein [Clostridium hominis]MDU2671607.1 helix-turn-helix domain-containing protein [Clostridium sp.]